MLFEVAICVFIASFTVLVELSLWIKLCNRLFPDNKYSVFNVLGNAADYILLGTVSDEFNFQCGVHGKWIDPTTSTGNTVQPK
ncbi:hypothetical protein CDAR_170831 [Caerostris darwini]|uniref:Uncharacterized protein n=1 Tax=Caerostris darwini TaxID=1538125 RepID=A0AAV4PD66_9ARAC|nr:hypothetical protein CDAR_170831 [Caerostris darwini]